ncbi:MAG: hypothetical protein K0R73_165 [Candidatus Midichloriaceae bacterium]|jgi:hypothetical protein|nr:hypothetical protein [Candidatus Midichloriaceae bacterium]
MQNHFLKILGVLLLFPYIAFGAEPSDNDSIKLLSDQEIRGLLDQKLMHRIEDKKGFKGVSNNFSFNCGKSYSKMPSVAGTRNAMVEQQGTLNSFKSFNQGPSFRSEDFYGFSMKFKLDNK